MGVLWESQEDFENKLIIASTHSIKEVKIAQKADFITFSPIFDSKGRKGLGTKILEEVFKYHKRIIALGGIISQKEIKEIKNGIFKTGIKQLSFYYDTNDAKYLANAINDFEMAKNIKNIKIPLLGLHNVRNATAAAAVAITIGISKDIIKQGLKEFKGVQRRFNKIFKYRETEFYDDYAHHPTEVEATIK